MSEETTWLPPQQQTMPAALQGWLTDTGSLTRSLQAQADQGFSVKLLGESWVLPLPDEARLLGIASDALVYQREVQLLNGADADVYARTVIPRATFDGLSEHFMNLGTKPLGELLFTDPSVRRGDIQVACIIAAQALYKLALQNEMALPTMLWGRRSPFYVADEILLVNEIFLPKLTNKQ